MIKSTLVIAVLCPLSNKIAASVIVNAILFDTKVVRLVAHSTGNCLEQKWELMSVFDKDELDSEKKIFFSKGFFANVSINLQTEFEIYGGRIIDWPIKRENPASSRDLQGSNR